MKLFARFFATTALLILAGSGLTVSAQMVTDRPDFTESPLSVPRAVIQLEAGFTLETFTNEEPGVDLLNVGEALVRWGVTDRFEARLELPNYNRVSSDGSGESIDGFDDLGLGVKYQFLESDADLQVAGIVKADLPTGSEEFKGEEVNPEAVLVAGMQITPDLSLAGQVTSAVPKVAGEREFEWGASISGAAALGRLAIFVEFKIDVPGNVTAPMWIHSGLVLPVTERFQLDVHGGIGVTSTAPDGFVGAGFAVGV